METYTIRGLYTISCEIVIEAESLDEAMEIAECCDGAITTEWNGNSVFVDEYSLPGEVTEMRLEADGMLRDLETDDFEEDE